MKTLSQTEEQTILHYLSYDSETGEFHWINRPSNRVRLGDVAGSANRHGYVQIRIDGRFYMAHRLAFLFKCGKWPTEDVDHIDGVKTNNRFDNLRLASDEINAQNLRTAKSSNKSSGVLGVYYHRRARRWMSTIYVNGKHKYLGLFDTPEQAHQAYLNEKRIHHPGCTI